MTNSEAQVLATEALELARLSKWEEVLALPLGPQALDLVRQKNSINTQIENLEQQEALAYQLLLQFIQDNR